ncbi:Hypothetical protein ERGA_CDS_09140 [Ehrlichia ruminantium str. Gardel]|nr:Hypothetical protein ERGA_CDS_09140 [Ehrlichia ruminantium str. Gardel]
METNINLIFTYKFSIWNIKSFIKLLVEKTYITYVSNRRHFSKYSDIFIMIGTMCDSFFLMVL